ncbi:MAG: hypothetical protein HY882_06105 [Deltaproteobacteria bacterium]|nr:hypothetical protein [Deltaproteobacteria bacterium]
MMAVFIGLATIGYVESWGADWKAYGETGFGVSSYDTENITHPSKNIVRVWTKTVYSRNGTIRLVIKHGSRYENLSHSVRLWEINCVDKTYRFLSLQNYSQDGVVLFSEEVKKEWDFIVPDSMDENLYKEVCQ